MYRLIIGFPTCVDSHGRASPSSWDGSKLRSKISRFGTCPKKAETEEGDESPCLNLLEILSHLERSRAKFQEHCCASSFRIDFGRKVLWCKEKASIKRDFFLTCKFCTFILDFSRMGFFQRTLAARPGHAETRLVGTGDCGCTPAWGRCRPGSRARWGLVGPGRSRCTESWLKLWTSLDYQVYRYTNIPEVMELCTTQYIPTCEAISLAEHLTIPGQGTH